MRDGDLRAVMRLVVEGQEDDRDPDRPLPWSVLEGLRSLVGCDGVSVNLIDSVNRQMSEVQGLPADPREADPDTAAWAHAVFFQHYWDCAPCSYADRTGDLQRVVLVSDFYSPRQFHETGLWSAYLRESGRESDLIACLAGVPGRTLRMIFSRGPGRGFGDRERALVWLLRPHLCQLYRSRRTLSTPPSDLTARQLELLRLVAAGHTNRQIARILGVAESTVRKHLENVFDRLGVQSRTAAAVRAFPPDV